MSEIRKQHARLRGLRTSWIEAGSCDSPLLLMLHGYPDTPKVWEHQIGFFARHFHVICPYQRGTHHSPGRWMRRFRSDSLALDYLQILDRVDPQQARKVFLLGHDIGAFQAWHLAPLLGKRLARLAIINGLSPWQIRSRALRIEQWLRSWYVFAFQIPFVPEFATSHFAQHWVNFAYHLGGLPPEKRPQHRAPRRTVVQPINHYRAYLRELLTIPEPTQKLDAPALILWGSEDPFLASPMEAEFETETHKRTIRILKGGHWLQREAPEEINEMLTEFFEQAESSPRQQPLS